MTKCRQCPDATPALFDGQTWSCLCVPSRRGMRTIA
jgi:hypothetical protein